MRQLKEFGILKELLKETKRINKRLVRVEKAVQIEQLTKEDLREIRKSEAEVRRGKYKTIEEVKKELGME